MSDNKQPRRLDEILEELCCCPERIMYQLEQKRQHSCMCPSNCKLLEALNLIESKLTNTSCEDLSKEWIDNQDVMQLLHISPRTLQTLRTNGTLAFSRIGNKLFYRNVDLQRILNDNYTMNKIQNYGSDK